MRRARLALAAVGVAAFLIGVLTAVVPGAAALVPVGAAVAALGSGYALVAAFGVAALVVVLSVLAVRALLGIDQADPPVPERAAPAPYPGAAIDEALQSKAAAWLESDRRRAVRARLRETVVGALARETDCSREEAKDRVDRGAWTDDDAAAAFLAGGAAGLGDRLTGTLSGAPPEREAARRAAEEIARREREGWE